jgi:two-component system chemotaxis response regulator CheB
MGQGQKKRILVVDDSAVMRSLLRSVIGTDAALEIAGTAQDGESALRLIESLRPDLVLLDVEMPVMDGLQTLREMRGRNLRPPVIMCSALTQRGARVTIESLASGAADYVAKPSSQLGPAIAIQNLAHDLIPKIHALTTKSNVVVLPVAQSVVPGASAKPQAITAIPTVVVIGISTGGPAALDLMLPALPATFPLPVLIVQHMPELFTHLLAERLRNRCRLDVHEAVEGEPVKAGVIYIARGNWHMQLEPARPKRSEAAAFIRLTQGPQENHCRPAADVLFRTAAAIYGSGVLGVVMTGMGSDGLAGSRVIRQKGGTVLAQDQATSAVWGMPGAVAQAGVAQKVLPLNSMADEIIRLANQSRQVENKQGRLVV